MTGTPFAEFAPIYHAAAQMGFSPQEVDGMEVWQLASVLGLARPDDKPGAPTNGRDLTAARIAAANGRAPKPEARPPDPQALAVMQGKVT